jgi:ribosome-binding protein aMBF1 (putative translation factor)
MNEELLNKLLRRGIQSGDVSLELNDAAIDHWLTHEAPELSDAIKLNIKRKLKLRLQDVALHRSAESLNETITPLGRLILAIRDRAGLSRADVSERLGKPDEYLRQIEESDSSFANTTAQEFVDLMQILHLAYSKVAETVMRTVDSLRLINTGNSEVIASGMQNDKPKDHLQTSSASAWQKVQQVNSAAEAKKAMDAWLTELQSELRKRNRMDLLD